MDESGLPLPFDMPTEGHHVLLAWRSAERQALDGFVWCRLPRMAWGLPEVRIGGVGIGNVPNRSLSVSETSTSDFWGPEEFAPRSSWLQQAFAQQVLIHKRLKYPKRFDKRKHIIDRCT